MGGMEPQAPADPPPPSPASSAARRLALIFLALAPPLMLLAPALPRPWADGLLAVAAGAFPVALIALGAARRGRLGRPLAAIFLTLLVLLVGSLAFLVAVAGRGAGLPRVGGVPLAAVIEIAGLFLAPFGLVVVGYALTFDRWGLAAEDLARLRRLGQVPPERDGGAGGRRARGPSPSGPEEGG
jgi:hypothetical protein